MPLVLFAAFAASVVGANWALDTWGVVPIGFGLMAPAGVYFAGVAFGLRDALHEAGGRHWRRWVLAAIATGALLSWLLESGGTIPGGHAPIAVASAVAFGLSELADLAVYAPLRRRADKVRVERIYHGYGGLMAARGFDVVPGAVSETRTAVTDHRWWVAAVIASNVVGAGVDSALFLWLAFGSLNFLTEQVVGKGYMVAVALPLVWGVRRAVLPRHPHAELAVAD